MKMLRRFGTDQRGATALLFGLATLPIVLLMGAAVDYSRAASVQSRVQRAVDLAALALVRESPGLAQAEFVARAEALVASVGWTEGAPGPGDVTVERTGRTVRVTAAATLRNAFMSLAGYRETSVRATSEAAWSRRRIELALVLDNTGSMADTISGRRKIDALKDAARKLLSDLRAIAYEPETIKVSLVPFDTEVRLDAAAYRNKDWFRWASPGDRLAWTGYVVDRYRASAAQDDAPDLARPDTLFPAPRDTEYRTLPILRSMAGDLAAMRPLTSLYGWSEYDALGKVVDGMRPRGYTNIALGAMWGLATLTPSEPFAEAAPLRAPEVAKYLVILTDGDNTMSHVDGALQSDVGRIDGATRAACQLIKDGGIELFTIRLLDGNADLLRTCASLGPGQHYFNVRRAEDLTDAFQSIVDAIGGTRLTQ